MVSAGEITTWLSSIITSCSSLSVVPFSLLHFHWDIPKTVTGMWGDVKIHFQIQWEAHQLPEQTKVSSYLAGRYQFTSSLLSESWLETVLRLENCTVLHGFWGPGLSMAHQELMQSRTLDPYLLMVSISSPLAHTFWFPEKMSLYIKVRLKSHPSHWE